MWPTLEAIRAMGGSGTIQEIAQKVLEISGFSEEQQNLLHGKGPQTEIEYRLGWARTNLKLAGALDNSGRGVWSMTEKGRNMTEAETVAASHHVLMKLRGDRRERRKELPPNSFQEGEDEEGEQGWKERLLDVVLGMSPDGFERLAQRVLREAGFISVTVTGRSGDEGIDGLGVYRMSLISFPVFFQCKRYRGSVRAGAVRDFRGAMTGRGDKGLLITTGTFTAEAKQEATRDGAPPIDLIDGDTLCELLKQHSLGVKTTIRTIHDVDIDSGFFAEV
jgi:restriction system protein